MELLCTHSFRSKRDEKSKHQCETTAEAWPLLKQPSEYVPSLETSSAPSTITLGTGLGLGHNSVWKVWHHFTEGEESEISSQRNSLKTKREKHYVGALGLLLSWIKHHNPIARRYLWAALILVQEIDFHSGQSQTSPSPLPRACHTGECSGRCGSAAASPCTHCPWGCPGHRWQMLFREAKHQTMSLGWENKEPEHLPDERVLQQHQPGRERPGRHCRKTANLQVPEDSKQVAGSSDTHWLLIRSDRLNAAEEVLNTPAAVQTSAFRESSVP